MGASVVAICNLALAKIGGGIINAVDEGSPAAAACHAVYDACRDMVIGISPWPSCTKRAQLAQLAESPAFEWTYAYQLPTDYIAVVRLGEDPSASPAFTVEGRQLLTGEGTARLIYLFRNEDPAAYEPLLVELIATRLAIELATSVAGNASVAADLRQQFERLRVLARGYGAFAVGHNSHMRSGFVEARS